MIYPYAKQNAGIDSKLIRRFRLEPRADRMTGAKWLVILDMKTGSYIKADGNPRAYAKLCDSEEAYLLLRTKAAKGELTL